MFNPKNAVVAAGASLAAVGSQAFAAVPAEVSTAISGAQTDALDTGYLVVAAVAALVVIGLLISVVRKV